MKPLVLISSKLHLSTLLSITIQFLSILLPHQTLISLRNFAKTIRNRLFSFLPSSSSAPIMEQNQSIESLPPFDPLKPSRPVSFPLTTLEELESRSYFESFHFPFNKASVPLPPTSTQLVDGPRLLVCHDMAGGYIDDKWIQGVRKADSYAIWHWYLIDVFVYFSHSLVTIPPPCWINTAHTHGVKVLGTFITEWDEGRAICNTLLQTKASAELYAERLTELAAAIGFDGWLINMEIELDVGQIPNLKVFVDHLTRTMHSSVPGSLVIWYDSVTIYGDLTWQNQLNDKNKPFFDLCDGIFMNYTWKEDYPKLSAAAAGDRKFDVYMGIDVFGRNTFGGGQWTTNVALDLLKKDAVSAAIFAPGWIYETKQPPDFQTASNSWWNLVEKSWGIVQSYPKLLPFYSNFDQGHGYHFSVDGKQISNDPWCNLSCQSFQPVLDNSVDSSPDTIQVMVNFKDSSFNGGGNITFKGTLEDDAHFATRLFQGELPLDNVPVHITYATKSEGKSLLGLSLELSNLDKRTTILLADDSTSQFASQFDMVAKPLRVTKSGSEAQTDQGWVIQESSIAMNGYILKEIHALCYTSQKVKQARKLGGTKLAHAGESDFFASLGYITIKTPDQNSIFPPPALWLVEAQDILWSKEPSETKSVSVKITWKLKEGDSSQFQSYNIYAAKQAENSCEEHIGVARVQTFYVSDFTVPPGVSSLKFIIQACGVDGTYQKLDSSPGLVLDVEGQ